MLKEKKLSHFVRLKEWDLLKHPILRTCVSLSLSLSSLSVSLSLFTVLGLLREHVRVFDKNLIKLNSA